jgi:hypothetical protein
VRWAVELAKGDRHLPVAFSVTRRSPVAARLAAPFIASLLILAPLAAQDSSVVRSQGPDSALKLTFSFNAGMGGLTFVRSLYVNSEDPDSGGKDNWIEAWVKPGLVAEFPLRGGVAYGTASVVGEGTYAAPPALVGPETSSFNIEDLAVGWRSGVAEAGGRDLFDLKVGRSQYRLGKGFLLFDGAGEGGTRGGYWSNARRAWALAAVGRFAPGKHLVEGFYLDRSEVPENDTKSRLWGVNYEFAPDAQNLLGATYLSVQADPGVRPTRDGLQVIDLRAFVAPFRGLPGLAAELEYAHQENGEIARSTAWSAKGAYTFRELGWTPTLSYRYAYFQGDDPGTAINEGWDQLFVGFTDWGTWFQGEIAGGYFLGNSNLISHQARIHVVPAGNFSSGVIGYLFQFDQPQSFAPTVTSKDVALEIDWYGDLKISRHVSASAVAAYGDPRKAVEQFAGRTHNFVYGLVYFWYRY